mmetsp:Transcript_61681/g.148562  ORF Transcript_61681/g.148562 Transcript_61681/m.148562 type:complete len:328 (+) Transcript_61681:1249-2232(+)
MPAHAPGRLVGLWHECLLAVQHRRARPAARHEAERLRERRRRCRRHPARPDVAQGLVCQHVLDGHEQVQGQAADRRAGPAARGGAAAQWRRPHRARARAGAGKRPRGARARAARDARHQRGDLLRRRPAAQRADEGLHEHARARRGARRGDGLVALPAAQEHLHRGAHREQDPQGQHRPTGLPSHRAGRKGELLRAHRHEEQARVHRHARQADRRGPAPRQRIRSPLAVLRRRRRRQRERRQCQPALAAVSVLAHGPERGPRPVAGAHPILALWAAGVAREDGRDAGAHGHLRLTDPVLPLLRARRGERRAERPELGGRESAREASE